MNIDISKAIESIIMLNDNNNFEGKNNTEFKELLSKTIEKDKKNFNSPNHSKNNIRDENTKCFEKVSEVINKEENNEESDKHLQAFATIVQLFMKVRNIPQEILDGATISKIGDKDDIKNLNLILSEFNTELNFQEETLESKHLMVIGNSNFLEGNKITHGSDNMVEKFKNIIDKLGPVMKNLDEGNNNILELREFFKSIKNELGTIKNTEGASFKEVDNIQDSTYEDMVFKIHNSIDEVTNLNSRSESLLEEQNLNNLDENSKEKDNTEEKEDAILNKILGKEDSLNKVFSQNRFSDFSLNKVEDYKGTIDIKNLEVDTVKHIKYMENNSIKELVVKVNPHNLGEITITLSMNGNEAKANISTVSKELYSYMNSNEIKALLNNENIRVSEVNISLYQDDTTFFKEKEGYSDERKRKRENGISNSIKTIEKDDIEEVNDLNSLDIIV